MYLTGYYFESVRANIGGVSWEIREVQFNLLPNRTETTYPNNFISTRFGFTTYFINP